MNKVIIVKLNDLASNKSLQLNRHEIVKFSPNITSEDFKDFKILADSTFSVNIVKGNTQFNLIFLGQNYTLLENGELLPLTSLFNNELISQDQPSIFSLPEYKSFDSATLTTMQHEHNNVYNDKREYFPLNEFDAFTHFNFLDKTDLLLTSFLSLQSNINLATHLAQNSIPSQETDKPGISSDENEITTKPVFPPEIDLAPHNPVLPPDFSHVPNDPVIPPDVEKIPNAPLTPPDIDQIPNDPVSPPDIDQMPNDPISPPDIDQIPNDPVTPPDIDQMPNDPVTPPDIDQMPNDPINPPTTEEPEVLDKIAPIAFNDFFTINEDEPLFFSALTILQNDFDENNEPLIITSISSSSHADINYLTQHDNNALTSFEYRPNSNYNGNDFLTYTIEDLAGNKATGQIHLNILPINDAPIANLDIIEVDEDQTITVSYASLLANDYDVDGDNIHFEFIASPGKSKLLDNKDGTIKYRPSKNFFGEEEFQYTISDGEYKSTGIVRFVVNPVADAPIAEVDNLTFIEKQTISFSLAQVLANDKDFDNDELDFYMASTTQYGELIFNSTDDFLYIPNENFNGNDSFTYYLIDETGLISNTSTVNINVIPTEKLPIANVDLFSFKNNQNVYFNSQLIFDNDQNRIDNFAQIDFDSFEHGDMSYSGRDYIYRPDSQFIGIDYGYYTITSAEGISAEGVIALAISYGPSSGLVERPILPEPRPFAIVNDNRVFAVSNELSNKSYQFVKETDLIADKNTDFTFDLSDLLPKDSQYFAENAIITIENNTSFSQLEKLNADDVLYHANKTSENDLLRYSVTYEDGSTQLLMTNITILNPNAIMSELNNHAELLI